MNKRIKKKKNNEVFDWYLRHVFRTSLIKRMKILYIKAYDLKVEDIDSFKLPYYVRFKWFENLDKRFVRKGKRKYE